VAESLVGDVRGFGELLFNLATGHDPPMQVVTNPHTGYTAFELLVEKCLTSMADGPGYVSLADAVLWDDLEAASTLERARTHAGTRRSTVPRSAPAPGRKYLAVVGVLLFLGLLLAVVSKVLIE
jgi:hypothetical protein